MSRHCTSGRPASIITENWRVKDGEILRRTPLGLSLRAASRHRPWPPPAGCGHLDLLAPQRRDNGVHRVADALARRRSRRCASVLKMQTSP
jgi:hypothetical protein